MVRDDVREEAVRTFTLGFRFQKAGEIERAIYSYRRSLELLPSAEAHTFLGWALSFQGRLEEAVLECRKAIELDPTLGNAYNDMGAYLIELGRPDEAVSWLEKGLMAIRLDSPCYPYFNLGRAHEALGNRRRARDCYRRALEADPSYVPALLALKGTSLPRPPAPDRA
jgi:tetratricopeptide (TPR) repeat protein